MTYEQMVKMFDEAKTKDEVGECKAKALLEYVQTSMGVRAVEYESEIAMMRIGL